MNRGNEENPMRRIVDYQVLTFAVVVGMMAGCASSSSPEVVDGGDTAEVEYDIVLPDSAEAVNLVTGEKVGVPARLADEPSPVTNVRDLESVEIADGADSDSPDGYRSSAADEANDSSLEGSQLLNQETVGDEATKGEERRSDGDDPEAALIVPKIDEPQDDAPLNNGREASAQPIPAGQRVAVAPKDVAPENLEDGRTPKAEPGAEVARPVKAEPTVKPTAPSRETLSDLPESIQTLDKDKDGQLGLYEWPREKLAEFKTLDSDEDGFLTPAELVAGQKKVSDAESPKTDKEPAESGKEEAKEKPATTTDDSSQPDDAKAPAADTTDTTDSPDTTADKAESTEASSEDEKSEQGN
jgi:hypothetical protein